MSTPTERADLIARLHKYAGLSISPTLMLEAAAMLKSDEGLLESFESVLATLKARDEADGKGVNSTHTPKKPEYCGSGHCSCIECTFEDEKQEPVAWMAESGSTVPHGEPRNQVYYKIPLYAHPVAKRPLLTDAEIKSALESVDPLTHRLPPGMAAFARAIERAVRCEA